MAQERAVMIVNVLGTDYEVVKRKFDDDQKFKRLSVDGYCDSLTKKIVHCDMTTYPGWEDDPPEMITVAEKQTVRHELVHAFFDESGLQESGNQVEGSWATNEEMVDWIALQGPKIYEAWKQAGAL